ncbi:hypothetical protein INS49_003364 [Diaporthe citri]|uniref:uncharacterized protein n=1 Tax=Diaporthe citri TaxID=83186 RepID=UPI001C813D87|nr:uncharacterized protein INS49_003364 [Diaporthe citri]KAG6355402.1 hypothetical protein INS49_003364 [Diaporthe citri]
MAGRNITATMSLRSEPDSSPVHTTLPAGPWPAGPTHAYNRHLSPVDLAASQGSIFRRRFERPGNYLIRLRQSDFKLPDPIPSEPLTYDRSLSAANPGDSPLPPPPFLRRCLPDFAACDMSRCGDADRFDYHADGEDGEEGELAECHRCGGDPELLEPRAEMHRLPCGHLLCGACLHLTAINAVAAAHSDNPLVGRRIREAAGELGRLRRDLAPRETPRLRAVQEARMGRHRRELLELLGLSCCGVDMHIVEDWILCLDEWAARSLWAVTWRLFRGEGQYGVVRCAWRDCGAAIPSWCSFKAEDETRWYCVSCEGNSMCHGGGLAPAR